MKKCVYCKSEIDENSAVDICQSCGIKVWGEKLFKVILENMEDAKSNGTLCHSNS